MTSALQRRQPIDADRMRQGRDTAGLVGLVARGALYLALSILALELVLGKRGEDADPRGAMHDLAQNGFGIFVLGILCTGFAAFAFIHLYRAIADPTTRRVSASTTPSGLL
jgi:hypothetical protein